MTTRQQTSGHTCIVTWVEITSVECHYPSLAQSSGSLSSPRSLQDSHSTPHQPHNLMEVVPYTPLKFPPPPTPPPPPVSGPPEARSPPPIVGTNAEKDEDFASDAGGIGVDDHVGETTVKDDGEDSDASEVQEGKVYKGNQV
ncbi:hypothetical protein JAAARDRAFT_200307 [Jaapia argillacea MUCL 33604]|uniref:Uncharacterized protein n=1 Tax=Jaapia argillacea MUCL 33604 TaxID=933084 RepID=A0A067P8C6_9AGAM|nr:hypothetical protein JAAARDRAFT_200307 [Jaapia argillacea MUCL 33604]